MEEKGRAPKLLLNQGPSEPCYATEGDFFSLGVHQARNPILAARLRGPIFVSRLHMLIPFVLSK